MPTKKLFRHDHQGFQRNLKLNFDSDTPSRHNTHNCAKTSIQSYALELESTTRYILELKKYNVKAQGQEKNNTPLKLISTNRDLSFCS